MPAARGGFAVEMTPAAPNGRLPIVLHDLAKTFSGDLEATSTGIMVSYRADVPGSAGYVAIEIVTGSLDGRSGSFVLQHSGIMDRGGGTLSISVLPDSGTGGFAGLTGDMAIAIDEAGHHYQFDYELPDA